ncbi:FAD/NAD(P)-binding domain-containing protein [Lindgomyces ingoldianus]|uniref:FAD/NAD(P)-binding domain-containing protein n=1 Tax=Lindgomyces ingoldianus TaxID=673940 RepID=A0ACB6R904_9PLEO|nr:FAD/NAD(P)-binding domain-containing protein [Lindgomyces ingoldianus]KAF2475225.1 FAD/NAD(P)-binding domain-containing protein [Lindgomyces ingoldianus]
MLGKACWSIVALAIGKACGSIINEDVAVLGGGASGTYAAVRLREDFNTSIVVIEQKARLGGHVDTYTIPGINTSVEYGVQTYFQYGAATDFFARFGVEIGVFPRRSLTPINVDISNGALLSAYTPPSMGATGDALATWVNLTEKYESIMEPGYWNFPAGHAIPPELLLPFGEYATKYNLAAAAPRIMAVSNVGIGGLKKVLTLYVMQAFGAPIAKATSLFSPKGNSNSLLYQRAYDLLKDDVLLESRVAEASRELSGIRLVVKREDGTTWLIKAKRLLVTAPPSLPNLEPFDLDKQEKAVFSTWTPTWSFAGVLKVPCIPENYSVSYISSASLPSDHLALRDYPFTLRFDSTGPSGLGLFRVLFATNYTITHAEAKVTISESAQKLVTAGTFNTTSDCKVDFVAFTDHNSILWRQSVEQIKAGFVQKLYALQGHRATWYTGGLFGSDYTSTVWALTSTVLPKLLKGL